MLYIRHRINTVKDLATVPLNMGIELDLRTEDSRLILQHDPFKPGEDFENLLRQYRHEFIILNVKTDGIEEMVLSLMKKYGIKKYFFLDLAFPTMIKLAKRQVRQIAIRFSEYEPLEQCLVLKDNVEWVWIDCFNQIPLNDETFVVLKKYFKLCLVSPELQNHPKEMIADFKTTLKRYPVDAVCTKYPELWER